MFLDMLLAGVQSFRTNTGECFLLDCGCEYKGVGSYESIKKKAVGMWTHTHITRLDHLEKLGAWHKLGVCV